jgi:hypothetical protein
MVVFTNDQQRRRNAVAPERSRRDPGIRFSTNSPVLNVRRCGFCLLARRASIPRVAPSGGGGIGAPFPVSRGLSWLILTPGCFVPIHPSILQRIMSVQSAILRCTSAGRIMRNVRCADGKKKRITKKGRMSNKRKQERRAEATKRDEARGRRSPKDQLALIGDQRRGSSNKERKRLMKKVKP